MAKKSHIGSNFDDLLEEDGILEEVSATALKRVIAWQIEQAMKKQKVTKTVLAARMQTSRSQVDRILDPDSSAMTFDTLTRTAHAREEGQVSAGCSLSGRLDQSCRVQ